MDYVDVVSLMVMLHTDQDGNSMFSVEYHAQLFLTLFKGGFYIFFLSLKL